MIAGANDRARLHTAAQALETLIVKQLVTASKTFTGGDSAGSGVRAGMFADTLAEAMVKGGGIGLAAQLERSLGAVDPPPGSVDPPPGPLPSREGVNTHAGSPLSLAHTGRAGTATITSHFGLRQDPFDGHLTRHQGVDLRGAEGETVRAAGGGVVRQAGARGGYGDAVEIDHGHGLTTLYGHASELLVREGDVVTPGQPIARVGHSGRATGSHLHFEVRQDGKALAPEALLGSAGASPGLAQPLLQEPERTPEPGPGVGPHMRANRALKIYAPRSDETSESGS